MLNNKKIAWQSWNAMVTEFYENDAELALLEELLSANSHEEPTENTLKFLDPMPRVLYTPYGPFPTESFLKPSDRWDCWICYTNFDVTISMIESIEGIDGVEAIKAMGRYPIFIGIAKLFNSTEVKLNIENLVADTKHINNMETAAEDLKDAIEAIKDQVSNKPYWSIFVSSVGDIDYIMSDSLDEDYLHDLNKFENLRKKVGGIIIRSSNEQKH